MDFKNFCASIFKVGCIGFGGGNALVPIMEEAFIKNESVKETEEDFDRDVIVANLTPGALPVELSGAIGRHNFGIKGMIAGPVLFAAPGLIGTLILFALLSTVKDTVLGYINVVAVGVSSFIIALLFEYIRSVVVKAEMKREGQLIKTLCVIGLICIITCGSTVCKVIGLEHTPVLSVSTVNLLACVFFIAFFMSGKFDWIHISISVVLSALFLIMHGKAGILAGTVLDPVVGILMIVLSVYGLAVSLKGRNIRVDVDTKSLFTDIGVWLGFVAVCSLPAVILMPEITNFLWRDLLSTVISFGGGDAYLTIADGMFVDTGIIPNHVFYSQVITVVNVLPGSILCKTLFGIGFYVGYQATSSIGIAVVIGLAGFACSVAASCIAFFAIYYMYAGISQLPAVMFISEWIRPIVCGLLVKVMLSLVAQSMSLSGTFGCSGMTILIFMLVLAAWNVVLRHRTNISRWLLVMVDMAIVFIFFLTI